MSKHLPDYWLERYAQNELPAGKMKAIHEQLAHDHELQRRLAEIKQSNEAILRQYPAGRMAGLIRQRLTSQNTAPAAAPVRFPLLPPPWALPAGALAAAAVLTLCLLPVGFLPWLHPGAGVDITRLKGMETGLTVYRQQSGQVELLQPYAYARRGDLLQIAYVSLTEPYGVIVSLDGRGTVTLHYPANTKNVPKLQTRHKTLLPKAYELDDAPGYERFFLVTSTTPFAPETILQAARALAKNPQVALADNLPLNRSWRQYSVIIQKEKR